MSPIITKTCKRCECALTLDNFYQISKYKNKKYYAPRCKPCYNKANGEKQKKKYVKKVLGFHKLSQETRDQIKEELKTNKKTVLAKKYNILYQSFVTWTNHKDF